MVSIGGVKSHNDCYRSSEPHGEGVIPVKLMFYLLCGDHTGDASSRTGRTRAEKAMDLALLEQPNMVRRRTLKHLVALEATDLQ